MGVGREAGKVLGTKTVAEDLSGSTAIIALVLPGLVAVANLGDSRAVLISRPAASSEPTLTSEPLSFDHKPEVPEERQRVVEAGGIVKAVELASDKDEAPTLIHRIYLKEGTRDSIAMSRALGDFQYKARKDLGPESQMVSEEGLIFCLEECLDLTWLLEHRHCPRPRRST